MMFRRGKTGPGFRSGVQLLFTFILMMPATAYLQTPVPEEVVDIFDANCTDSGCHAGTRPAGDLSLVEEAIAYELVNVRSSAIPKYIRVVPGRPERSYLMAKLLGSRGIKGKPMPRSGELPRPDLKAIFAWIKSLGENESESSTQNAPAKKEEKEEMAAEKDHSDSEDHDQAENGNHDGEMHKENGSLNSEVQHESGEHNDEMQHTNGEHSAEMQHNKSALNADVLNENGEQNDEMEHENSEYSGDGMYTDGMDAVNGENMAGSVKPAKKRAVSVDVVSPRKRRQPAFPGWAIANLPTTETVGKGGFSYRIAHKFAGAVGDGIDTFFGLDAGALMLTQFAVPLSNDLTVSLQRTGEDATVELSGKYRFMKQDGSSPVAAAIYGGVDWSSTALIQDPANTDNFTGRLDPQRFAYFAQLPLSHRASSLSMLVVPGVLFNGNARAIGESPLITLGLGGRYNLSRKYSVFAEWVPILAGAADAAPVGGVQDATGAVNFQETVSAGFEIATGGHVFHFFVTNTAGNTTNQYMSGGNFDIFNGDMRIGFNIFRVLNYPF